MGREAIYSVLKMLPIMELTEKGNTSDKAESCNYSLAISFHQSDPQKLFIFNSSNME